MFANVYMIRESDLKLVKDRPAGRPPKPKVNGAGRKKGGRK